MGGLSSRSKCYQEQNIKRKEGGKTPDSESGKGDGENSKTLKIVSEKTHDVRQKSGNLRSHCPGFLWHMYGDNGHTIRRGVPLKQVPKSSLRLPLATLESHFWCTGEFVVGYKSTFLLPGAIILHRGEDS